MTTKVVIYNEGPKTVCMDGGVFVEKIAPGERAARYLYIGSTVTLFEENDETEISKSEG